MRVRRRTTKIGGSKNGGRTAKEETGKIGKETRKERSQAAMEPRAK